MPDYSWPEIEQRQLIGQRVSRVEAPLKVSGEARYTSDVKRTGMLQGKILRCPYAHARILSIDTSRAERMPGVKAVHVIQGVGSVIHWAGDDVVAVAATDESTAEDAIRAIKIEYEKLPHRVSDDEPGEELAGALTANDVDDLLDDAAAEQEIIGQIQQNGVAAGFSEERLKELQELGVCPRVLDALRSARVRGGESQRAYYRENPAEIQGEPEKALGEAEAISGGVYGATGIAHCCLESHGSVAEWTDGDHLLVHVSTQNVSGIAGQMSEPLNLPAANIRVQQDHVGGGYGSKFSPDRWGIATARLSSKAGGKPVRTMLERDAELKVAGARTSAYARVRVGAKKDGTLTAWDSKSWGTAGPGAGDMAPIPYVFGIRHSRVQHTAILTNLGPARPWRGSNHPQAALITMSALDDLAARLAMDPLDLFLKNLDLTGARSDVYREELEIAAERMAWRKKWKPRPKEPANGVVRGVGLSIHTGGGRGHMSNCDLTIHPDGSVAVKMATQDIGTGTRTLIAMVAADTLGIPMEAIELSIGDTAYPASAGSGGSSTPGGVSASTRRAGMDARDALFAVVAPFLKARKEDLESFAGMVRVKSDPTRSMAWKEACAKLGAMSITLRGKNPDRQAPPELTNSGVGGVGMAEVEVDADTGIVKVKKMVAVQDCGLIVNPKLVESSCKGAMVMGISSALFEEKVMDRKTGQMLNANMEFYRLAGMGDIPELVVHLMTGKGYDERGVIGVGEPPVISVGAAISNAVANAIGVRVPFLPLTPDRVLAALSSQRA